MSIGYYLSTFAGSRPRPYRVPAVLIRYRDMSAATHRLVDAILRGGERTASLIASSKEDGDVSSLIDLGPDLDLFETWVFHGRELL